MNKPYQNSLIRFPIYILPLLLLLIIPEFSLAQRVNISDQYPVTTAENRLWFGTPNGLYQYDSDDDSFKRFNLSESAESADIKQLYYDDEILWCITECNLLALYIRLNESLMYDSSNGLPSNKINRVVSYDDYIWAATENGIARFSLLIEEWELLEDSEGLLDTSVSEILVIDDIIWFIAGNTIAEYDPMFEQWRYYQVDTDSSFITRRGFVFGDEIWLTGNQGIVKFDPELKSIELYYNTFLSDDQLLELFIEGNVLWAVSRDGLFSYNDESGNWKAFEGNGYLSGNQIINSYITQSEIWVLFENEIRVWDRLENTWEVLDYSSGLTSSTYDMAYIDGETAYLINPEIVNYRVSENGSWRVYSHFKKAGSAGRLGRKIFNDLFDNDSGGHIDIGDYIWSWDGTKITYIRDYSQTTYDSGDSESETTSGDRLDIKSKLIIDRDRSISGFYNNIDYSETEYGIRYRGKENDFVREINWGDFTRKTGSNPFNEETSLFGSNIWLRSGEKTPRFKRSLFNLKAISGEQQTRKTYEHYQGATSKSDISIADINYLKNQFYVVPGLTDLSNLEQVSIYVDDINFQNNTSNTLARESIAGILGDYDLLKVTEDYYIYEKHNLIRLTGFIRSDYTIVMRYSINGVQSEVALQYANTVSTSTENIYYLGGTDIIPYSFNLSINDTSGENTPIQNFQLDSNNDRIVDSDWIDFQNGILVFPDDRPFPIDIYDQDQPQSYFQINANYQTELSLIQLSNRNLVRGSEVIKLNGIIANTSNDYVLDYTNGTLVFIREGIVNSDTRIEIEYQYYLEEYSEQVHGTDISWNPSDDFSLQGEWLQFTDDESTHDNSTQNLFSLNSEVRRKLRGLDFIFNPGIAYHAEDDDISGVHLEGLVSSPKFRFQTKYKRYSDNYSNLYEPQFILGDIKQQLQLTASAEPLDDIKISGEFNENRGLEDSSLSAPIERTGTVALLFHRNLWPVWKLSYQDYRIETSSANSSKNNIMIDLEYNLPKSIINSLHLYSLKLESSLRKGKQSGIDNLGVDKSSSNSGHVRLNSAISDRFQTSFYYRRDDQRDDNREALMYRSERALFDLDHEEWRFIQSYVRLENETTQDYHISSMNKDVNHQKAVQLNFRFLPGALLNLFSPTHFEFNLNRSISIELSSSDDVNSWVWQLSNPATNSTTSSQDIKNYYLKNELNLYSRLMLTSLIEWNNQETKQSGSMLDQRYSLWSEKFNYKLNQNIRFYFQYRQYDQDSGYDRTEKYYEPSTWVEHRWTQDIQNTYYVLYRKRYDDDGDINDNSDNLDLRYNIIWRKDRAPLVRRFEIRQTLSWSYINTKGDNPARTYRYNSNTSFDFYPLLSTILRCQIDLSRYIDDFTSDNNRWDLGVNIRMSLRF